MKRSLSGSVPAPLRTCGPWLRHALLGLVAVAILSGCARPLDPAGVKRFNEAQRWFDQARGRDDYLRAASLYQEILDSGFRSGAVLYNQGNAYMRAGQRGRALAAYAEAMRYRPRDPQLRANLALARGGGDERVPLVETVFFWQNVLSYREKYALVGLLGTLAATLAAGAILWPQRRLGWSAGGAVLVLAVACASAIYDWHRFESVENGVVVVHAAVARKGDSPEYEPAFTAPLAEGTVFRVVGRRGPWLRIRIPGGEGWIEAASAATY